jgi:hypothetical protein
MSTTALIFAAIAVALVIWWNRKPQEAAPGYVPPPFPPVPSAPAGPAVALPLPGAAPIGGGLHPLLLGAILLPWGLVAFQFLESGKPTPTPDSPTPAPVVDLDLRGVWHGEHAAEDAGITECLLADLADFIEDDGKLEHPRLVSGTQLAELRKRARQVRTRGVSLAERQPRAIDAISAYLDREIGDKGGPLEAGDREKWVKAFRGVSDAARVSLGR